MENRQLEFPKPVKLWQAIGLLEDEQGYTFCVYVSGPTKAQVEAFIELVKAGEIKITPEIKPGPTVAGRADGIPAKEPASLPEATELSGLRIGISRLNARTQLVPPYTITYTVDPPLAKNQEMTFTFDDQSVADLLCTVSQGKVDVTLFERDQFNSEVQPRASTASAANPVVFHERSLSNTNRWGVRIRGRLASNAFALAYDKIVN